MTAGPKVTVEGADTLDRTLKAAADEIEDLRDAHSAAAGIVAGAAASRAPRRSGRLAGSISASTADGAVVDVAAPYAGPIHWGWETRGIGENRFALDAARETESRWVVEYEQAIVKALEKVRGV